ncbi:MAG: hypothetical protein FD187_2175 [bacterium]|nr:MAG: hypothetical protein FD142_2550 [bacterium]KAF0148168.1 MAG: hypothetical protein FD187_2175 [bacterium]KAF0167683.1 MAG: hypothetical protein FD158_2055 [bacterium]TXT21108.1 MAG: hypothetical protein FD132_827 [bacterium]
MAKLADWLRLVVLAGVAAVLAVPSFQAAAGVGLPKLERGKGEKCVEDTQFMRRNHMELLKHQRDDTMRKGIRTTKHSLKGCVECHAGSQSGSVAAGKDDFCMACHVYTGTRLDCWDCHATKPGKQSFFGTGAAAGQAAASPRNPAHNQGGGQ